MKNYENIKLDKDSRKHLYIQLFEIIRDNIIEKKLRINEKLPPIRQLAKILEVNNSTVVNAYSLLQKKGLVYKKIGSGTFVSEKEIKVNRNKLLNKYPLDEDLKLMDRGQIKIKENMISFASATPTADLFPVEDFKNLLNEVIDRDKGNAFSYQESQGFFPLRESLVNYLENYEIYTKEENIQIVSGAQQGIDVISKAFVNYNDNIIVESPTYTGAIATFKSRGANIISVPILKDGIDIEILEDKIKRYRPKLIYIMPNFQNPTGYSYNFEKKIKILELAKEYDFLIVEDDYLSDLNFYSDDNMTLKSMDIEHSVIYIKSFSKIFMPGLRLGFLVIPKILYPMIIASKHASDISTSGLNQRVFDLYLRKGTWKEHIELMKKIYKERFDIMVSSLNEYIKNTKVKYILPQGGVNFWFELPKGYSSGQLYMKAAENNILILPGSIFFASKSERNYFRMSIAAVYPEEIKEGIKLFSEILFDFKNLKVEETYTPLL